MRGVAVIGVGMSQFGRYPERSLADLAGEAIEGALTDAGLAKESIEMAFVANSMSALITGQVSVVGQVVLSRHGIEGIPVYNIDNACAGSSSALNLATHAIRAGAARIVLVVGVEKLVTEDRAVTYRALNGAADLEWLESVGVDVERESVFIKHVYADRLREYEREFTLKPETLARIAVKNRAHATHNAVAQYREPQTVEEVLGSRMIVPPITARMCAPLGDGAAAAVVVCEDAARASDRQPIWISGSAVSMGSRPSGGQRTLERVAKAAYEQANLGPEQIDVAEVHDATAFSELLAYEDLGFAERGTGPRLVAEGVTTLGGRLPVNTSGGLESRGHPIAATGVAQIVELVTQLRGEAAERQVDGARVALAETAGGFVAGDSAAMAVHILTSSPSEASNSRR
jgi:acetyl-CoA acyltransferase